MGFLAEPYAIDHLLGCLQSKLGGAAFVAFVAHRKRATLYHGLIS